MAKAKAKSSSAGATKPRSKSEVYAGIAETTGLTRKQVASVFDSKAGRIKKDLGKGPGLFTAPGLMKIKVVKKPATKARKMISPFTGEEITVKAKPARKAVKVLALKGLKAMV